MTGRLPVWKARRIAEQTIPLKAATAGFVDDQLAEFAHRLSLTRITRCVEAAIIRHQPDLAQRRAEAAAEHRGVWLEADTLEGLTSDHRHPGLTGCPRVQPGPGRHRHRPRRPGRRLATGRPPGRAVGVLADPQYALDLHTTATSTPVDGTAKLTQDQGVPGVPPPRPHPRRHRVRAGRPDHDRGPARLATRTGAHRRGPALAGRPHPRHPPHRDPGGRPRRPDRGRRLRTPRRPGPAGRRTRPHLRSSPGAAEHGATYDIDHIDPYVDPTRAGHRARPRPPTQPGSAGTTTA